VESAFVKGAVGQGVERAERVVQKHGAIAASRGHYWRVARWNIRWCFVKTPQRNGSSLPPLLIWQM
jgi:hypothetical protein